MEMGVVIVGAFSGMDKSSRGGIENILANFAVSWAEEFMELFEKLGDVSRSREDCKAAFCDRLG